MTNLNTEIINLLGNIIEAKSFENGQHVKRVQEYTRIIAEYVRETYPEYKLNQSKIESLCAVSPLHDIGKIKIPDSILLNPNPLTDVEFEEMKKHTIYGYELLKNSPHIFDVQTQKIAYQIIKSHHEKYDGNGYPEGLIGDAIPITAQIVSIADCFDALTTKRVYKDAYSPDVAKQMLLDGKCGKFSNKILQAFVDCYDQMLQYQFVCELQNSDNSENE